MKNTVRVKFTAFTLAEMMVVLVISSVLSIAVYQAMLVVSQLYTNFDSNQRKNLYVRQLLFRMSREVELADRVKITKASIQMFHGRDSSTFKSSGIHSFYTDLKGNIDSLKGISFSVSALPPDGLPETIAVFIEGGGDEMLWHLKKRYSSAQRINYWRNR